MNVLPRHAEVIVVGGGTAGAIVAARLAEAGTGEVLLLEAGPDYGVRTTGRWPADLLDASAIPTSHDWGYSAVTGDSQRPVAVERARVIGGCSAHNGCTALWGGPATWDGIAACGLPGWDAAAMDPIRDRVFERLGIRVPAHDAVTPYHAAWLDAALEAGYERIEDLNASDAAGIGVSPVNIRDGVRWNTAFAWLDPVRDHRRLTIVGDTLVDRLAVTGDRVVAVEAVRGGTRHRIGCERVVLAAGVCATPAILQRSGIGDATYLGRLGIAVTADVPGVGANLQDHPSVLLPFAGTDRLGQAVDEFAATAPFTPEEQTVLRARSSRAEREPFDIHLYPFGGVDAMAPGGLGFVVGVACMMPRSRGTVRIVSADPAVPPRIDLRLLTDAEGHDRAVLAEGVAIARAIAGAEPLHGLIGEPRFEPDIGDRISTDGADAAMTGHYYHAVGTCRIGPGDVLDVCDNDGRLHALANGYVADASLFPVIPLANTCIPVAMAAEAIADRLTG